MLQHALDRLVGLTGIGWPEERDAASSLWRHSRSMPEGVSSSQCKACPQELYFRSLVTSLRIGTLWTLLALVSACQPRSNAPSAHREPAAKRTAPVASQPKQERGVMAAVAGVPPDYTEVAKELPLFEAAGLTREKSARFLLTLRGAVERDDREAVAGLVAYPVTVRQGKKSRSIKDRAELLRDYDAIFTEKVRTAVRSQRVDLLKATGRGAEVGSGEVRFGCPSRLLTKTLAGAVTCDGPNIRIVRVISE